SSAVGSLALATGPRAGTDLPRMQAWTTVETVHAPDGLRLYNTRRVRVLDDPREIGVIVDRLCREGVQVEGWLPKAGQDDHSFDLRILVIAGEPRHTVVRCSQTPMTNLHLLNPRGDLDRVRASVPPAAWESAMESCRRTAALFPGSLHAGVDL